MSDSDEWITIAEAARLMGISDRHARRLAKRLADQDRRESDSGPDVVRKKAFVEVARKAREVSVKNGHSPDVVREESGPESERRSRLDGLVGQLRSENAYLRSELTAQREAHGAEIQRRDVAEAELRRMVFAAQQEAIEAKRQLAITGTPQTPEESNRAQTASKRPWWKFWKTR
jgi:hypothetical protein